MTGKPDQAADALDGFDDDLAVLARDTLVILQTLPRPTSDLEVQRRFRAIDLGARSAMSIRKLRDQIRRPRRPQDEDDMNDAHTPDEPETLERKYRELDAKLDRFAQQNDAGAAPGGGLDGLAGLDALALDPGRQPQAA
ncbi:MAG: hypothetical protein Q7U20_11390 [Caulobacter sp.]|nr:hypothetical protein [Caulobacter sp.]